MNKITAAVLVILSSTVFGLVFIKQIKVSQEELSNYFANDYTGYAADVAGASIVNPRSDSTNQLDRSVNSLDINGLDENSAKIEAHLEQMDE
jgi:hypothetical protein